VFGAQKSEIFAVFNFLQRQKSFKNSKPAKIFNFRGVKNHRFLTEFWGHAKNEIFANIKKTTVF